MIPIVAIGASAGGREQLFELLAAIPVDSGAAFVVLQHLDPDHVSELPDLLANQCVLPVVAIEHDMPIVRDRVHVIPAGHTLGLDGASFRLARSRRYENIPTVIDRFFRELADARRHWAVGIILSGTGNDGALGLKAIKAAGGLTLVQDPDSAEHDGMPRAALQTAGADFVGATADMPAPLSNHLRLNLAVFSRPLAATADSHGVSDDDDTKPRNDDDGDQQSGISAAQLDEILRILNEHDHHSSFAGYKPNMLKRRVVRRMGLSGIYEHAAYVRLLANSRSERAGLSRDFRISVTNFFRDSDTYERLRERAIEPLFRDRETSEPVRVWVPGCATGEEAYSIAILLAEAIEAAGKDYRFLLFATDVDRDALETARAGLYPEPIVADVSERRLRAFFDRVDGQYQIKHCLRQRVVFAAQNVIEDPPYSRLDLISCRDLLMYLNAATQQRVLAMFHFALKRDGFLFLGSAESVSGQLDLFEPVLEQDSLFRRIGPPSCSHIHAPFAYRASSPLAVAAPGHSGVPEAPDNVEQIARELLLRDYVPAAVLINRKHEILCSYGPTGDYLSLPIGGASLGLVAMAHDELRSHVRAVTHRAFRDDQVGEVSTSISQQPARTLTIRARPLSDLEAARGLVLVTFEPAPRAVPDERADLSESAVNQQLADELETTRSELQNTIQSLEATNEDLKGANEEALSMNEDLRSTNEELKTSKEELQALNEELTTVNSELEHKVNELETAHNDLSNLFSGTQVASVFLDRCMCIMRFTPAIQDLLSLIHADVGRPLADITRKFSDPNLEADAEAAIAQLAVREQEIRARSGQWYLRRALPYRTLDDTIAGVVLTFTNITEIKRASMATREREREQRLDMAMSAVNGGMWEMRIDHERPDRLPDAMHLSARLKRLLGFENDQMADSLHAWTERIVAEDRAAFLDLANRRKDESAEGLQYRIRHRDGSLRWFASYGTLLPSADGQGLLWIGMDCDITEQRQTQARVERAHAQLRLLADALPTLILFVDRDRRVRFYNRACNEWFTLAADDILGHALDELLDETARARAAPCIETALAGRAVSCELEVARDDHATATLQVDHVPFVLDGEVLGFYALMTNVSNWGRRRGDQPGQQANMIYIQRMAMVGEMASTVAHDLAQPLSSINTYAGALTRMLYAGKPADETTPLLRKIADQVERAGDIIRQTRDFVGHGEQGIDPIDLNAVLQDAVSLLASRSRKLNVDMRLDVDTALPPVNGHAIQIQQVLVNLIGNAFDAMEDMDDNSRILWLTTSTTGEQDTGEVRVTVTDSGPGIDAGKVATVFESFHTTKLEGMGMGLSISRAIARWHGGRLWVESQPGQGAAFFLTLPIATTATASFVEADTGNPSANPDRDLRQTQERGGAAR